MNHKAPLFLLSCLALASCGATGSSSSSVSSNTSGPASSITPPPESSYSDTDVRSLPAKERTYYQLLVYSFADGNGDGIGDFKGIIDHLDYLEGLGIGGIWLSPILKAKSYHAYDVIDYYTVNPDYEVTVNGTKYDLAKLLEACHAKGMTVLMDMVFNHTANECGWVQQHPSWYKTPDAFPGGMKDLNYDNTEVRAEIKKVGKYWLDKGVDGFRLDAAKWIYNYGGVHDAADDEKNFAWWKEFYQYCQGVNQNVYMVGEVLVEDNIPEDRLYYKTMMDSNFNFELRSILNRALSGSPTAYINHLVSFQNDIRANNPNAIEASCVSNHDIGRYNQKNRLSAAKQSLVGMLNVLAPGDSYVYYGDELGLEGSTENGYDDMAYRTPMPFSSGRTNSVNYFAGFKGNGKSTTKTLTNADPKADLNNASSLARDYADTIKAKNRSKTLYSGKIAANSTSFDQDLASFITTKGNDSNTVIFNFSSNAKLVDLGSQKALIGESAYGDNHSALTDGKLYLAPYACAVFDGSVAFMGSINAGGGETSSAKSEILPDDPGSQVNVEKSGSLTIHCAAIDGWNDIYAYAWVGNNTYLGQWPGTKMTAGSNGWYDITIPHGATNIIFNSGNNGKQTADLFRPNAGEYWFVADSGENKTNGYWYTQNPKA